MESGQPIDPVLAHTAEYFEQLRRDNISNQQLTASWELFHECLAPLIDQLVRRNGLPREVAEDCVQEVWIEVFNWLPRLTKQTTQSFMAWLATVVDHKVAEHLRKTRRKMLSLELQPDLPDLSAPSSGSVNSEVLKLAFERLRATTSRLNYEILHMRIVQKASVQDVASEFKITGDRVRYRTHRARAKLRDILRRLLDEE